MKTEERITKQQYLTYSLEQVITKVDELQKANCSKNMGVKDLHTVSVMIMSIINNIRDFDRLNKEGTAVMRVETKDKEMGMLPIGNIVLTKNNKK